MIKTIKNIGFYSFLGGAFLGAPLDTPFHRLINPHKANVYNAIRPALLKIMRPEYVYDIELYLLSSGLLGKPHVVADPALRVVLPDGRQINNPLCLAAGYDRDASATENLFGLGFGALEVGSVIIDPERNNLGLRFDYDKEEVRAESYGNAVGAMMAKSNLHAYYRRIEERRVDAKDEKTKRYGENRLLGINIVPNTETLDNAPYLAESDFEQCSREMMEYSDYLVLNVAAAKVQGTVLFQSEKKLRELIRKVRRARTLEIGYQTAFDYEKGTLLKNRVVEQTSLENNTFHSVYNHYEKNNPAIVKRTPLLLIKVDPNESQTQLATYAKVALEEGLDGIVVGSHSEQTTGKGLIAGGKLTRTSALEALKLIYQTTQGKLTLISNGGVFDAKDVVERIKNGASLVQIYSSFMLYGPEIVPHLMEDLSHEVKKELALNNLKNLNQLIGSKVDLKLPK